MFDGFTLEHLDLGAVTLRVRHGGSGPPIVLLHGHPRTHTTWWRVAPQLAQTHTVVCPDLRGYGGSSKPVTDAAHSPYSKRAMAADIVGLMERLGHTSFTVVGHDRGSYVALRLALDHPQAVDPNPLAWYGGDPDAMGQENYDDYLAAIQNPDTVHAMCEDYRAGLTADRAADAADREAGTRLHCPTLVLWSERDDLFDLYGDPAVLWREWATNVQVGSIDSGHQVAEEAPEALTRMLLEFVD